MAQILLGALAFALAFGFDCASWLRATHLKPLLGLASAVTMGVALFWTLAAPGRYSWPAWTPLIGWPLLLLGTVLLLYSLLIEIPFTMTYVRRGVGDTLVKTGTYALCRHPGVLWFGLSMLGLALVSQGHRVLLVGAAWLGFDVIYVWLQDVFLFPRMFPGYRAYQKETPMLVPTWRSVAACFHTWPGRPRRLPSPQSDGCDP